MREVKEKVVDFKPKVKAAIKPKTSGENMKLKVMKNMERTVRVLDREAKALQSITNQQTAEGNPNSVAVSDLQSRMKNVGRKGVSEAKKAAKKSFRHKDISKLKKDMGKLKKDFQRDKIRIKMSSTKQFKAYEVRNNAGNAKQAVHAVQRKMKAAAQKRAFKLAQKQAQSLGQRTAVQTAKVAARTARYLAKKITMAMVRTARIAFSFLGGGGFLVAFIAIFAIVGAVVGSPFGIFYSGEDRHNPDVIPVSAVVGQLNATFNNELEYIQDNVPHDSVTIDGEMADWCEVLAVFAVKANEENDVVTIDQKRVDQIKVVFWDMNSITYDVEVIHHGSGEDSWTETILHIHVHHKTADQMRNYYSFTEQQNESLDGVLEYRSILLSLIGNLNEIQGDAQHWIDCLDPATPAEQRKIVETAASLVGKVNYFWGGKYSQFGWCNEWGSLKQVTASGSKTTGTMRVYGLDCSGFVTWVFINASGNLSALSIIGEGTYAQWDNCTPIAWSQAQIGDLVFYGDLSHVGIVIGKDMDGDLAICHCASGKNNVVITGISGFTLIGRPSFSMF